MEFQHFVQLIAIGLQARIPMHMTGFPGETLGIASREIVMLSIISHRILVSYGARGRCGSKLAASISKPADASKFCKILLRHLAYPSIDSSTGSKRSPDSDVDPVTHVHP